MYKQYRGILFVVDISLFFAIVVDQPEAVHKHQRLGLRVRVSS